MNAILERGGLGLNRGIMGNGTRSFGVPLARIAEISFQLYKMV
jgi:hypothetical protein